MPLPNRGQTFWFVVLAALGLGLFSLCFLAYRHSHYFAYEIPVEERPLAIVNWVFLAAFVLYLVSIWAALKLTCWKSLAILIVGLALAMRVLLVFSHPFQEIDFYRYIWDGQIVAAGFNPYRYPPDEIYPVSPRYYSFADREYEIDNLRMSFHWPHNLDDSIRKRIHYANLCTVYPPVSQAVFAGVAKLGPIFIDGKPGRGGIETTVTLDSGQTVSTEISLHVFNMKLWIVLFDALTIALIWYLLRTQNKPLGWLVAYAWCPLVLKEFANSGHLDSIAVFLSIGAIAMARGWLYGNASRQNPRLIGCAVLSALAIGAKLYPIIFVFAISIIAWRKYGWRQATTFALTSVVLGLVICMPMLFTSKYIDDQANSSSQVHRSDVADAPVQFNPTDGLTEFLSRWEMNDFLFMVVHEPLKAILPDGRAPFLTARALTGLTCLLIAFVLSIRARTLESPDEFLRVMFLIIAWFWLLAPTQNPWYWTWALPLIAFTRYRTWLFVSGAAMIYYWRFWFLCQTQDYSFLGFEMDSVQFYDYWVVSATYLPILAFLTYEYFSDRKRSTQIQNDESQA